MSETSEGKLWPANVPVEAEATKMLLGEVPAGEFQSVVDSFRASLGPVEKGVLDLRSNAVLVTALAVKWRLTAAIAVAPVKRSEVDLNAVQALVQESQDAVLGLTGGVASVTDFNLKQIFESTKRALQFLSGKLQKAVPAEAPVAPPAPPEPVAAAPEPAAVAPAPPPAEPPLVPPPAAVAPAAAAAARAGLNKGFLIALGVLAVIAAVWHGMNYMREQADSKARQEREAKLPTEYTSGKVTQITLLKPTPEKIKEIEERAQSEGKRLIKISDTEYQLVAEPGGTPAPEPTPTPEENKPPEPGPEEGKAPEPAPAPEKKEAEGATP